MIHMGPPQNHWPKDITEQDMRSATQDTGWATKPFKAPTGVGIGIKMACPCGCHTVGLYHLVEKEGFEIDDQWFPKVDFMPTASPSDRAVINMRHKTIRLWVFVGTQSAYGPGGKGHRNLANKMAAMIPGIKDKVPNPCDCKPFTRMIWGMIQHLNDAHHPAHGDGPDDDLWSRERIADWLETLDADLVLDPDYVHPPQQFEGVTVGQEYVDEVNAQISAGLISLKTAMNEMIDGLGEMQASFVKFVNTIETKQEES